ncbi:hypothetical protein JMJ55_29860 [Belnapia sp. T6]|uniref:Uncharacterized protein n=1 Tax=Belnapia mucosa TaxID=2804532 RepID=A0ABS1VCX1_9PROT|nr:hypothetical protein [Belnapia mucosa]MBL6459519.1 hypothetical protein [Belnapia mucosa]
MAGAARARGLAPRPGQWRWTGEFSASTSGEHSPSRYRAAPKTATGSFDHDNALTGDDLIEFVDRKLFPYLQGFRQRATSPNTIEYKIGEIFSEIKNRFRSGYSLRDALERIDTLRFRSQAEKHELSHLWSVLRSGFGPEEDRDGEQEAPA